MNLIGFLIFHRFYDKFLINKKTECKYIDKIKLLNLNSNCF